MSNRRRRDFTDEEIDAIADAATEFPSVSDEDLRRAVAVSASGREKVPISIRIDREALEFFQAGGPGYQTRINDVLLRFARGELVPGGRFRVPRAARTPRRRVTLARTEPRGAQ